MAKHYLVYTSGVPALLKTELVSETPKPEDYDWGRLYYARVSDGSVYWTDNWTLLFKFIGTLPILFTGGCVISAGHKDAT